MDRGPPQKRNGPAKIPFAGHRKTEFLPPGAPRAREVFCSGAVLSGGRALGKPAKGTGHPQGVPAKPEPAAGGPPSPLAAGCPAGAGAGIRQGPGYLLPESPDFMRIVHCLPGRIMVY